jgi:hypothetical protein
MTPPHGAALQPGEVAAPDLVHHTDLAVNDVGAAFEPSERLGHLREPGGAVVAAACALCVQSQQSGA